MHWRATANRASDPHLALHPAAQAELEREAIGADVRTEALREDGAAPVVSNCPQTNSHESPGEALHSDAVRAF